jgi:hypothetical protein
MHMPQDIADDMQNDARKFHCDRGFVRLLDGSWVPEHLVRNKNNSNVPFAAEEIRERLQRRKPLL